MLALASEREERVPVRPVLAQAGLRSGRAFDACRSRNHRRTRRGTFCEQKSAVAVAVVDVLLIFVHYSYQVIVVFELFFVHLFYHVLSFVMVLIMSVLMMVMYLF